MNKYEAFCVLNKSIKDIKVYEVDMRAFYAIKVTFKKNEVTFEKNEEIVIIRLEFIDLYLNNSEEYKLTIVDDIPYPYDMYEEYLTAYIADFLGISKKEIDTSIFNQYLSKQPVHTDFFYHEVKELIRTKEKELANLKEFDKNSINLDKIKKD